VKLFVFFFIFVSLNALASLSLDVGTYNIRNFDKFGASTNKELLESIIRRADPDLLAVQEIFNAESFKSFVAKSLPEYRLVLSECGGGGSQKLGFLYKDSALELLSLSEDARLENAFARRCGSLRPALIGIFKRTGSDQSFAAVNVHLKAGSGSSSYTRRARQYRFIQGIVADLRKNGHQDALLMGDFNTTGYDHRDVDYRNFAALLGNIQAKTSAEQVACSSYWGGQDYNDNIEEPSTLDHVVYTNNFLGAATATATVGSHCERAECKVVYDGVLGESYQNVSDHCPVTVSFR